MSDVRTIVVEPEPLTAGAWAPFGEVPVDETERDDPLHLEFRLADPHLNFIFHAFDEVEHTDVGLVCDHLNRHDTATQALMPTDRDAVLVVAPASVDFSSPGDAATIRAFRLPRHAICNLAIGTWHWGPFPTGPGRVRLLNLQGKGFPNDNAVAHLTRDLGVRVEVRV